MTLAMAERRRTAGRPQMLQGGALPRHLLRNPSQRRECKAPREQRVRWWLAVRPEQLGRVRP